MNIYRISQTKVTGYDTYSDAVVVAETAGWASRIFPSGHQDSGYDDEGTPWYMDPRAYRSRWAAPDDVVAEYIGEAHDDFKAGTVICASFHAG